MYGLLMKTAHTIPKQNKNGGGITIWLLSFCCIEMLTDHFIMCTEWPTLLHRGNFTFFIPGILRLVLI